LWGGEGALAPCPPYAAGKENGKWWARFRFAEPAITPRTKGQAVSISVLDQAKIQAQVLVPLIKALQAELGEARANALVRKSLGDLYRRYGEEFWKAKNETNLGKTVASAWSTYARDDALDYRVLEQSEDAFEIDVTRCRYAEFYKQLGEPELGFLVICSADFDTAEGFGNDIKLTLTQTIMQGASHCDFRYKRAKSK
jgi:hypothetical protein